MNASKRLRLDPQVRRDQILDAAALLITREGLTAVSMERVARDAAVSKALVYNYFGSQSHLLSDLLVREYRAFQYHARKAAIGANGLDSLVRTTTRAYLDHVSARGSLIQHLTGEPLIAARLQEIESADRPITSAFFAGHIVSEYGIDPERAQIAAQMLMGLTGAAGNHVASTAADIQVIEDMVVSMISGALKSLAKH